MSKPHFPGFRPDLSIPMGIWVTLECPVMDSKLGSELHALQAPKSAQNDDFGFENLAESHLENEIWRSQMRGETLLKRKVKTKPSQLKKEPAKIRTTCRLIDFPRAYQSIFFVSERDLWSHPAGMFVCAGSVIKSGAFFHFLLRLV